MTPATAEERTMKITTGIWMGVLAAVWLLPAAGRATEISYRPEGQGEEVRRHTFYVGFGYGPTTIKPVDKERVLDGISYRFDTDANDLGGLAYAGYWISDHVGVEIGGRDYGKVDVPFEFYDPHDFSQGTGASEVGFTGFNVSLLLGFDLHPDLQVFGRVSALSWQRHMESNFDIPGQPRMERTVDDSGTGLSYGAGLSWRFQTEWRLLLQYEQSTFEEDELTMTTLGLCYDFRGLRE